MAKQFWQHDPSAKFPCKDCPDRHTACWSECEKYKKAKEENDEKNRNIAKQKQLEKDFYHAKVKRSLALDMRLLKKQL